MNTKRIKILTQGPIKVKAYMNGPVIIPYRETIDEIKKMLLSGVHVVEVLSDGTEIKLDMVNVDKINEISKPVSDDNTKNADTIEIMDADKDDDISKYEESLINLPAIKDINDEELIF